MKIAIIAPASTDASAIAPPLPLGYLAAVLEQQRHIVRIYDLAASASGEHEEQLGAVRAFRPHLVLVTSEDSERIAATHRALSDIEAGWVMIASDMRGPTPAEAAARARAARAADAGEHQFIYDALALLEGDLDALPAPARHLLPIERYRLAAPSGALQTSVYLGQPVGGRIVTRNSRMIVTELRSIVHEHGIWHVRFDGIRLSDDPAGLHDFLYGLMMARLGVSWEATTIPEAVTPDMLKTYRRAGCEALALEFDAMHALESQVARKLLGDVVSQARAQEIHVRGLVLIEPRYSSIPALVDVSTTFGMDDVTFRVRAGDSGDRAPEEQILDMAQSHYRTQRSRQQFVERYGAYLGPMIWRVGKAGLLGRDWQRVALGDQRS